LRQTVETALKSPALSPAERAQLKVIEVLVVEGEQARVGELSDAFVDSQPAPIQKFVRARLGELGVKHTLSQSWSKKDLDLPAVKQSLIDVRASNPKQADRLHDELVLKAKKENRPELVNELRDLKLDDHVDGGLPPCARHAHLVPEAPAGTRAGQREPPTARLADLGEEAAGQAAAGGTESVKKQVAEELGRFSDFRYALGQSSYRLLRRDKKKDSSGGVTQNVKEGSQASRRRVVGWQSRLASISAGLKRPLRPSERLLIEDMHGKTTDEIVQILKGLD
jgi:hypothetical protein